MPRNIEAYKIRSEFTVDAKQGLSTLSAINKSVNQLSGGFGKGLGALSGQAGQSLGALQKLTGPLKEIGGAFSGLASQIPGVGTAMSAAAGPVGIATGAITALAGALTAAGAGAVAAAAGIFSLSKAFSDAGSIIHDAAQEMGVSTDTVQAFKYAAEQSGKSLEDLTGPVAKFTKLVGEAARGSKEAGEKLTRFGLDPKTAIGDLDGALAKVFKRINDAPPGIGRGTLAIDAFGKSGTKVIPIIETMEGDLKGFTEEARKAGLMMEKADIDTADQFGDTLDKLSKQLQISAYVFAAQFTPLLTDGMNKISTAITENKDKFAQWGQNFGDAMRGAVATWQSPGVQQVVGWFQYLASWAPSAALGKWSAEYLVGKGREARAMGDVVGGASSEKYTPAKPKIDYEDIFGGSGKANKAKDDAKEIAKLIATFTDTLTKEEAAARLSNKAFFARREIFKEETVAIDLATDKYDKLNAAQKLEIQTRAREVGALERGFKARQLYATFLEDQTKATDKALEKTNDFSEALKELETNLGKLGVKMDEDQRKKASLALSTSLATEKFLELQKASNDLLGISESLTEQTDKWIESFERAGGVIDAAMKKWMQFDSMTADAKKRFEERQKKTEEIPGPQLPTPGDPTKPDKPHVPIDELGPPPPPPLDGWKAGLKGIKSLGKDAFDSFAQGMGQMLETWILTGEAAEGSMKKMVAAVAAGVAAQSAVLAIFETAKGLGALFWNPAEAAAHFQAAALYGILAVGGAVLGRALSGDNKKQEAAPVARFGSGTFTPGRAYGGPVSAGVSYIVGEHRPEVFTPNQNGYIDPSTAGTGGGRGDVLDRLAAALERFESMPADHVVMKGARGLTRAYDNDAGLIRDHGRRFNFA